MPNRTEPGLPTGASAGTTPEQSAIAARLEAIKNSTSWRLTRPLRAVAAALQRLSGVERRRSPSRQSSPRAPIIPETPVISETGPAGAEDAAHYRRWIEQYDALSKDDIDAISARIASLRTPAHLSLLLTVGDGEIRRLRRSIESVAAQLYPHWELCIADDASSHPAGRALLEEYRDKDARIRPAFRLERGGPAAAANTALSLATGEFVALLQAGDVLPPHALYRVAALLDTDPQVDLIYSDEDKIDDADRRLDPLFKPDWNPALILSHNYFGHLGFFRRSLVHEVGDFGVGFDGVEDYELLLRCLERTSPARIRHIPAVLYHRRRGDASEIAEDGEGDPWEAGRRAVAENLERLGAAAEVRRSLDRCYRVEYRMPNGDAGPRVSIVIPTTARLALIKSCVLSLYRLTTYGNYDINIAVSRKHFAVAERREFLEALHKQLAVRVLVHDFEPFSYAAVNNWAVAHVSGPIICFMNDDIEVITPDWLEVMLARLLREGVGAVGPKLYYPNDTIQHAGVILGSAGVADHPFRFLPRTQSGYAGRAALEQDVSCITGACLLIRREIFEALNGFSPALEIAYNDVDLCIRVRNAGWRIIWTPCAEFYHHESVSVGRPGDPAREEKFAHEIRLMRRMWGPVLDNDPFYNPNLSLEPGRLFHLADPPRSTPLGFFPDPNRPAQKADNDES